MKVEKKTSYADSVDGKYNVVIAGAGVSGLSLAALLAERGYGGKIAVFERAVSLVDKPCAGAITLKAFSLPGMNFDPFIEQKMQGLLCAYEYQNEEELYLAAPFVFRINRHAWLGSLLTAAVQKGVSFHENIQMTHYEEKRDGVVIHTNKRIFLTDHLIVASGAHPLGKKKGDRGFAQGLRAFVSHPDPSILNYHREKMGYDFGLIPFGYGWIFPDKDCLIVGIFSRLTRERSLIRTLYKYLNQKPILKGYSQVWGIATHPITLPSRESLEGGMPGGDRVLFLGDAGGLADPFTGEGIYYSIKSATIAADLLCEASSTEKLGILYQRRIKQEVLPDLLGALRLAEDFYSFPEYYYRQLLTRPRNFGELLAGEMGYQEFYSLLKRNQ